MSTQKAKYLPEQFSDHVLTSAYCVVKTVSTPRPRTPVVEADELPDPVLADNPDADTGEDTLPGDALTSIRIALTRSPL
jgi:hypothetical protein